MSSDGVGIVGARARGVALAGARPRRAKHPPKRHRLQTLIAPFFSGLRGIAPRGGANGVL